MSHHMRNYVFKDSYETARWASARPLTVSFPKHPCFMYGHCIDNCHNYDNAKWRGRYVIEHWYQELKRQQHDCTCSWHAHMQTYVRRKHNVADRMAALIDAWWFFDISIRSLPPNSILNPMSPVYQQDGKTHRFWRQNLGSCANQDSEWRLQKKSTDDINVYAKLQKERWFNLFTDWLLYCCHASINDVMAVDS